MSHKATRAMQQRKERGGCLRQWRRGVVRCRRRRARREAGWHVIIPCPAFGPANAASRRQRPVPASHPRFTSARSVNRPF